MRYNAHIIRRQKGHLMQSTFMTRKIRNFIQFLLLLLGIGTLVALAGWLIAGFTGMLWAFALWAFSILILPKVSPRSILRLYNAYKIYPEEIPRVYELLNTLAQKSNLPATPEIHYIPSRAIIAFSTGNKENPVIALSDGILRLLNTYEIAGVLAHEISHIKNNDIWIMQVSDIAGRIANLLAYTGLLLLALLTPLLINEPGGFPWMILFVLGIIPTANSLIQLSLSRLREYEADLDAAMLLNDPRPLASSLEKIDRLESGWLENLFSPFKRLPEPSLLRTHPPTKERIKRLLELIPQYENTPGYARSIHSSKPHTIPVIMLKPRKRMSGVWW